MGEKPRKTSKMCSFQGKKVSFAKRVLNKKGIHGLLLSSWADLFKDGIIKREHTFHSFINKPLKVQLS